MPMEPLKKIIFLAKEWVFLLFGWVKVKDGDRKGK